MIKRNLILMLVAALCGCSTQNGDYWQQFVITDNYRAAGGREQLLLQARPHNSVDLRASDPIPNDVRYGLGIANEVGAPIDTLASCDVFPVLRAGWGSSFGAFGMYYDYVFYDDADQVVVAIRRHVD